MRRSKLSIFGVAALLGVAAGLYARGPIGPMRVVHKDVQMLVESAAIEAGATVAGSRIVEPSIVPLPFSLAIKRSLKAAFARVGLAYNETELAEQYEVVENATNTIARCTVRIRGDHVLGVLVEVPSQAGNFTEQFLPAIRAGFPTYVVTVRFAA